MGRSHFLGVAGQVQMDRSHFLGVPGQVHMGRFLISPIFHILNLIADDEGCSEMCQFQ